MAISSTCCHSRSGLPRRLPWEMWLLRCSEEPSVVWKVTSKEPSARHESSCFPAGQNVAPRSKAGAVPRAGTGTPPTGLQPFNQEKPVRGGAGERGGVTGTGWEQVDRRPSGARQGHESAWRPGWAASPRSRWCQLPGPAQTGEGTPCEYFFFRIYTSLK